MKFGDYVKQALEFLHAHPEARDLPCVAYNLSTEHESETRNFYGRFPDSLIGFKGESENRAVVVGGFDGTKVFKPKAKPRATRKRA